MNTILMLGTDSNALGFHFFAGETALSELRRGVLAFDIAGNIPPGSTITAVSLSLNMSRTPTNSAYVMELHKLLADWGEGTSIAPGEEGTGAPATPNDATWRHRFFDTIFWSTQGGDFSATVSASQSVGPLGHYMWSSAQMVADVQGWLDNPASNFGWLMLGDESTNLTAKRFDTRESTSPPVLAITYIGRDTDTNSYANRNRYGDRTRRRPQLRRRPQPRHRLLLLPLHRAPRPRLHPHPRLQRPLLQLQALLRHQGLRLGRGLGPLQPRDPDCQ